VKGESEPTRTKLFTKPTYEALFVGFLANDSIVWVLKEKERTIRNFSPFSLLLQTSAGVWIVILALFTSVLADGGEEDAR
jgi:hypothetical protein